MPTLKPSRTAESRPQASGKKKAPRSMPAHTSRSRKSDRESDTSEPRLRIRLYRHGLGDCILLRFATDNSDTFNMLIDCGLIGVASDPKQKMTAVARDIAECCGGSLDVVVMTHEHWDHASGFSEQQAQAIFDEMDIGEVWYAWTEDPSSALGQRLRNERAAKVDALAVAASALSGLKGSAAAAARSNELVGLLSFFGLGVDDLAAGVQKIGKTRKAFEYLAKRPGVRVSYRRPGDLPYTPKGVPGIRIYALGPPEDEVLIKKSRPTRSGREVYELQAELGMTSNLQSAFDRLASGSSVHQCCADCPFEETMHARKPTSDLINLREATWDARNQAWRRIELDWTQAIEKLAIDLDSHTNNSCLALAVEFIDSGDVFLFPGDAQVGSWLSWQELHWTVRADGGATDISASDLLCRTVFYKVGHHGSHNATLRDLGLELMKNEGLVAYIPVNESEAKKSRWNEMPFKPLVDRLAAKTRGRLLRADDEAAPDDATLSRLSAQEVNAFKSSLVVGKNNLFYEISFN